MRGLLGARRRSRCPAGPSSRRSRRRAVVVRLDPASSESQQTLETLQLATGKLKDVEPALARRLAAAREQDRLEENYLQLQRTLSRIQDRKEGWAVLPADEQTRPECQVAARMARAAVAASADEKEAAAAEATAPLEAGTQGQRGGDRGGPVHAGLAGRWPARGGAAPKLSCPSPRMIPPCALRWAGSTFADNKLKEARETLGKALARDPPESADPLFAGANQLPGQGSRPRPPAYLKRFVELPDSVPRENPPAYLFLSQIAEEAAAQLRGDRLAGEDPGWRALHQCRLQARATHRARWRPGQGAQPDPRHHAAQPARAASR